MKPKPPEGIKVFGVLFIVFSLLQLLTLLDVAYYYWLFEPLPKKIIAWRYVFSLSTRLAGLLVGIGILYRKEICRKTLVFLTVATIILSVYWKHPFAAIEKHSLRIIDMAYKDYPTAALLTPVIKKLITVMSTIIICGIDIGFAGALLYYFTRPKIKEWFKQSALATTYKARLKR